MIPFRAYRFTIWTRWGKWFLSYHGNKRQQRPPMHETESPPHHDGEVKYASMQNVLGQCHDDDDMPWVNDSIDCSVWDSACSSSVKQDGNQIRKINIDNQIPSLLLLLPMAFVNITFDKAEIKMPHSIVTVFVWTSVSFPVPRIYHDLWMLFSYPERLSY